MFEGHGPDTWDYQWVYTNLFGHRLTIVPRVNLIMNIGFATGATHTTNADPRLMPKLKTLQFPLKHPVAVIPCRSFDRHFQKLYFTPLLRRIARIIGRFIDRASSKTGRSRTYTSANDSLERKNDEGTAAGLTGHQNLNEDMLPATGERRLQVENR
jgi:hypothetical protein